MADCEWIKELDSSQELVVFSSYVDVLVTFRILGTAKYLMWSLTRPACFMFIKQVDTDGEIVIMRQSPRLICCGDSMGNVRKNNETVSCIACNLSSWTSICRLRWEIREHYRVSTCFSLIRELSQTLTSVGISWSVVAFRQGTHYRLV